MQGYVARLGFGMTLIKNQIVDAIPVIMNANLNGNLSRVNFSVIFMILLMRIYLTNIPIIIY